LEFFLWVLLTWEEEDMGVSHAAEIKRHDRHSADLGMECSTIVLVIV